MLHGKIAMIDPLGTRPTPFQSTGTWCSRFEAQGAQDSSGFASRGEQVSHQQRGRAGRGCPQLAAPQHKSRRLGVCKQQLILQATLCLGTRMAEVGCKLAGDVMLVGMRGDLTLWLIMTLLTYLRRQQYVWGLAELCWDLAGA